MEAAMPMTSPLSNTSTVARRELVVVARRDLLHNAAHDALVPKHLLEQVRPLLLLGAARDAGERGAQVHRRLDLLLRRQVAGHGAQLAAHQRQHQAAASHPASVWVAACLPAREELLLNSLLLLAAGAGVCVAAPPFSSP